MAAKQRAEREAMIAAEKGQQAAEIDKDKVVQAAEIDRQKALEAATIEKEKVVGAPLIVKEQTDRGRAHRQADRRHAERGAAGPRQAAKALAEADEEKAKQSIITVETTAKASARRPMQVIQAEAEGEKQRSPPTLTRSRR
jgi:flotillin